MLMLSLTLLVSATPAAPASLKLALPGLNSVSENKEVIDFYSEHLAQQLKVAGLEVVTVKEISALLGMERQKQLLGCGESSCMAELASAMGADCVVLGDVAKVGESTQINLKIINATTGKTLATFSERATGEEAVVDALTTGAAKLTVDVSHALGRPVPEGVKALAVHSPLKKWSVAALVTGGLLAAAGGAVLSKTNADFQRLTSAQPSHPLTSDEALSIKATDPTLQQVGVGLAAAGGTVLVAGLVMMLAGNTSVSVAVVPSREGAFFALGGALP